MMDIYECLRPDTMIYLTRDRSTKKGLFYKDEKPELFVKDFNHAEFIGEELCNIRNLRCAHYFVVGCDTYDLKRTIRCGDIDRYFKYGIASYDFKDPKKKYKLLADYKLSGNDKFHTMLSKTDSDRNREELYYDMLELLALDIYMGQTDRTDRNIAFELDKDNNTSLSPLYDFEYSVNPSLIGKRTIQGFSDLIFLNDLKIIKDFIRKHPEFGDILKEYLDIDLCDVIYRAYAKRGLGIPDSKWQYYEEFEDDRQKVIKKII